jgi:uroporphyrinogen decarboxylase
MQTHERIKLMFEHKEADRVPIFEVPWRSTIKRWEKEGLKGDYIDYFGMDRIIQFEVDNTPRFPTVMLEDNDEYKTYTTSWGTTLKNFKDSESVPQMIDARIKTPDDWPEAKSRMLFSRDRINWTQLEKNWDNWRKDGAWIQAGARFGFDITHGQVVGTERVLFALIENPEWLVDMWQTQMDLNFKLFDAVWDAGFHFDALRWPDDMGYKFNQFFSLDMYRELLKPIHKQAIEWAHEKGIKAYMHSCGDVRPFIPELVGMGLDGLNPIEVKAGVDPLKLKEEFGDKLLMHGGYSALLWYDLDKMKEAVEKTLPILKIKGGFIFSTDHSTPSNVSLEDFREIVEMVKEVGKY